MKLKQNYKITFFLLCFFVSQAAFAGSTEALQSYETAQKSYFEQDYQGALKIFGELSKNEPDNGYLLYNLGNCHYKMGETGRAIQYYEKALLKIPRVSEVKTNLSLVRKGGDQEPPQNFTDYLVSNFYFWSAHVTLPEFRLALMVLSAIFWGWVFYEWLKNKKILSLKTILGFVILLYLAGGYYLKSDMATPGRFAIVIKPEINVKAIYMDKDKPLFQLHEGTKVKIIDRQDFNQGAKWLRIALPEGQTGWVLADDLGVI
ncbi:MAG: tetratricopeptide repeat protein [Deltaproteobacteria bacterium]|nr:tetratricopeptide repeat protein [Deltaproteobacteria bacterium]